MGLDGNVSAEQNGLTEPIWDQIDSRAAALELRWACVYTHPQAERWADANLRDAGYVTFLPMITVRRRDRVVSSMWHDVQVPAFSRYLFVRFDHRTQSWSPIRATPGVSDILRNGSEVAYTPDTVIERLRVLKEQPAPKAPTWQVGAQCMLTTGPLSGHPAVILSIRRGNASLAVLIFGALRTVSASLDALALLGAQSERVGAAAGHPRSRIS